MKLKVRIALFVIFAAVIGGFYYAYFPAINIHLEIFWTTLIVVFVVGDHSGSKIIHFSDGWKIV